MQVAKSSRNGYKRRLKLRGIRSKDVRMRSLTELRESAIRLRAVDHRSDCHLTPCRLYDR